MGEDCTEATEAHKRVCNLWRNVMIKQQGHDHRGVLDAIAGWVKSYRQAIGLRNEMANCTPEQVAAIARDMGLTSAELLSITAKGPTPPTNCHGYSARSASTRISLLPKILARCATCSGSALPAATKVSASTI